MPSSEPRLLTPELAVLPEPLVLLLLLEPEELLLPELLPPELLPPPELLLPELLLPELLLPELLLPELLPPLPPPPELLPPPLLPSRAMALEATRPRAMVTISATECFLKLNMRFLLKVN
jgi:hypothetical protein